MVSKTLAEEAAWRFAKDNSVDLVTLNPGFLVGPLLQPALNITSKVVLALTKGIEDDVHKFSFSSNCSQKKFAHLSSHTNWSIQSPSRQ